MQRNNLAALAGLGILAGCAQPAPAPPPPAPVAAPAPDPAARPDRRASVCTTSRTGRVRFSNAPANPMTASNDGWCGKGLTYRQGHAYTGGHVVDPPKHGEVRIRHEAYRTLVEYRASPGYSGTDSFSVELTPGNGVRLFDVTVQP